MPGLADRKSSSNIDSITFLPQGFAMAVARMRQLMWHYGTSSEILRRI
jgi:hypothetical protein